MLYLKNAVGVLTGVALDLETALGGTDVPTTPILLLREHGTSFRPVVSSSTAVINVLYFSLYGSCTSLVKFAPGHFNSF